MRWLSFFWVTLSIVLIDQLLKFLIVNNIYPGQTMPVLKRVFHLTYIQNTGAAFGLFAGHQWLLMLVVILVVMVILFFHFRLAANDPFQLPLAFILGGSLGNLVDRMRLFYVVDYLDFRVWPVFNFADIMINVGVFLILVRLLFSRKKKEV